MNILLRGSWQTVNVGDIAHSPAVLAILKEKFPNAEITLWASRLNDSVRNMLNSHFPDVKIVEGTISEGKQELLTAVDECDFLVHASAPYFVAYEDVKQFYERTKKPFGLFGITCGPDIAFDRLQEQKNLLKKAAFIYYRDSKSLQYAKENGIEAKVMDFGCDGVFAYNFTDELKATQTMQKYGLETDKFVCCIPRNRYTPYWEIKASEAYNAERDAYNKKMEEIDLLPLRKAIIEIVENTDLKVFICPEDCSQIALGKRAIYEKLPPQIQQRTVVKEEFWLPDEALAVYKESRGLFGCEMHSPIMCIGNGVPAIVARWREQTTKGYMIEDIGLPNWLFNFDIEEDRNKFPQTVLEMVTDALRSREYVQSGRRNALATYDRMCDEIKKYL